VPNPIPRNLQVRCPVSQTTLMFETTAVFPRVFACVRGRRQGYVLTDLEFPSLWWLAGSRSETIGGQEQLIADIVEDMASSGDVIPEPLSERKFSGTFNAELDRAWEKMSV